MTGGDDLGDDSRGRLVGRPWFVIGLVLALAATFSLVLADDVRYLRLGIVAALWAALVGAFLAVRYRRNAATTEEAVAQAQEVYELELEREIAARREYELEIESETRSKAEAESRAELDALRAEVIALRDSLQSLFGGEVLLERVALTAQATRMRALREEGRLVESPGNGRIAAQLMAAPAKESADRPTELIERVRDKQPARGRPAAGAPEPRRPERSMDLPPRRVTKNEPARPANGRSSVAASVSKAAAEARAERLGQPGSPAEQTRVTPAAEPTRISRQPVRRAAAATELTQPAVGPGDEPTQLSKVLDADRTPPRRERPVSDVPGAFPAPAANGTPAKPVSPAAPEPQPAKERRAEASRPRMEPARRFESSRPRMEPAKPAETSHPRIQPVGRFEPPQPEPVSQHVPSPVADEVPPSSNPTLPVEVRRRAQEGGAGGRRRKPEVPPETPAETSGGGRRRRPEGEPPSWQASSGGRSTGSHAKPDLGAETSGRRAAPEEPSGRRAVPEETGSHAAGRSVSDLLAAHGANTEAVSRRRRRADD
ncbi:MAG TPA: DUF6779 domain-containing protein [Amycolatopsis sp.]|nr:DUF6779 domain-containing protein [Amycolatopsis sp.]